MWTPGEAGAREKLESFLDTALESYAVDRDFPDKPATSPTFATPGARRNLACPHVACHAGLAGKFQTDNIVRFRKELAWREFCYHQIFQFPKLGSDNWNDRYDDFPWRSDAKLVR